MRKIILLPATLILFGLKLSSQNRQWDRPMQLQKCSVNVKVDMFTATTFIEMEFYNPNNQEIEGLFRFELQPGQAITAFQLDLFGKYRDGSIEEKWKATNAYNTIVGKRIDPALLTMESPNRYSLRIYPVPANGTRKVTMTIQQLLVEKNNSLQYYFPFNVQDVVAAFSLEIVSESGNSQPQSLPGLIAGHTFLKSNEVYHLLWTTSKIKLNQPVVFSIPLDESLVICTKQKSNQTFFALRIKPAVETDQAFQPKHITVFWDASASAAKRNLDKEINFLRQFISFHGITRLTIITFNHKITDKTVFEFPVSSRSRWQHYLKSLDYTGATQLGCLDLRSMTDDLYLLFSDGNNTFGKSRPEKGKALLFAVYSVKEANADLLNEIVGANGGKVINLNKSTISDAIRNNSRIQNFLMDITSASGKTIVEQNFPVQLNGKLFVHGTMNTGTDNLIFHYGNNNRVVKTEKVVVTGKSCPASAIDRISMLTYFDTVIRSHSWEDILDFGLEEKVVTPNTAYIVLERIEDYIKYNISPPAEMEKECEKRGFVKRDTKRQRPDLKKYDEAEILFNVAKAYNDMLRKWDANAPQISVTKRKLEKMLYKSSGDFTTGTFQGNAGLQVRGNNFADVTGGQIQMEQEVVVTTAFGIKKTSRTTPFSAQTISRDELSMVPQISINNALAGKVAGTQFREQSSINLAAEGYLRIRGGLSLSDKNPVYVVDGTIIESSAINPMDIESVTILKGANATALFGEQAKGGALVITTKRAVRNYYSREFKSYRLKKMEDVEYLWQIKSVSGSDKMEMYRQLVKQYEDDAGFYLDIARHFYESGRKEDAMNILMNAAEVSGGDGRVIRVIGNILEEWKEMETAIGTYHFLVQLNPLDMSAYRNLAWAHYQNKNYQSAVDWLFAAIKVHTGNSEYWNVAIKAILLSEMNAITTLHKDELDLTAIPPELILPMPADLRITLDRNYGNVGTVIIKEPGGKICSYAKPVSDIGGIFTQHSAWYNSTVIEYQMKKAIEGKYRISVNYYGKYQHSIPDYIRIITFRNFGKQGQSIHVENVCVDNQYGEVEIGEVKW